MSKIFITGGTGFLGIALTRRLLERGEDLVLVDIRAPDAGIEFPPGDRVRFLQVDITDFVAITELLASEAPSVVVHLATMRGGTESDLNPVLATRINCLGTSLVLEACRLASVRRVVLASSAAIYGSEERYPAGSLPLTEEAPALLADGEPVFSSGKLYLEALARVYHESYGLSTCGLRPSVVFGAHSGRTGFTAEVVDGPALGRPVRIKEVGANTRLSYVYVEDVARQFEVLCYAKESDFVQHRFFNSGGVVASMGDIVAVVRNLVPEADIEIPDEGPPDFFGVPASVSDQTLVATFGVTRQFSLERGIAAQIESARAKQTLTSAG